MGLVGLVVTAAFTVLVGVFLVRLVLAGPVMAWFHFSDWWAGFYKKGSRENDDALWGWLVPVLVVAVGGLWLFAGITLEPADPEPVVCTEWEAIYEDPDGLCPN